MGTPELAARSLKKIIDAGHDISLVLTQPDRKKNRKKDLEFSPVKKTALENNIEVLQPEKVRENEALIEKIKEQKADIIVVAAYGQILPKEILDSAKYGAINVHGSILPKLRGASPIQHAILEGHEETGVTIMYMDEGLDTGDIISTAKVPLKGKENSEELYEIIGNMGADLLVKTIADIENENINRIKQDDSKSTLTKIIKKSDGKIDFQNENAVNIDRKVRGYYPWPGTISKFKDSTMKIIKCEVIDKESREFEPGEVTFASDDRIDIQCKEGIIRILELQLPGKKVTKVSEFLRGHKVDKRDFL